MDRIPLAFRVTGALVIAAAITAASGASCSSGPSGTGPTGTGGTGGGSACVQPPSIVGNLRATWTLALGEGVPGGVAIDAQGNAIVAGAMNDNLTVDGRTLATVTSGYQPFVLALAPDGSVLWERSLPGNWLVGGVGVDSSGGIYLAGVSFLATDLGNGPLPGSLLVAKLGPTGDTVWSHGFEAYRSAQGNLISPLALAASPTGDVAVVGTAIRPVDFGGGAAAAPGSGYVGFLAVFDGAGNYRFDRSFNSTGDPVSVAFDEAGGLVFGGSITGTLDLGGGVSTTAPDTGGGFVARLDANGNAVWANALGGATATTAVAARAGVSFTAGSFESQLSIAGLSASARGLRDLFLAVTDEAGGAPSLTSFGGGFDRFGALAPAPDGGVVALAEVNDYIDLGSGLLAPNGLALGRYDRFGRALDLASFDAPDGAQASGLAVDATGAIVATGTFSLATDLGAGVLTGAKSFNQTVFVARYAPAAPGPARHAAPCAPPVSGALLSSTQPSREPTSILLHGDTLFFTTGTEVLSVPVAGGTPVVLAATQRGVVALAADDQNLYWVAGGHAQYEALPPDGALMAVPLGGGDVTVLADAQDQPRFLAVDDELVYWTAGGMGSASSATPSADGQVRAVGKAGGAPAVIADGLVEPGPIGAAQGWVAFAAGAPDLGESASRVAVVPRAGGQPTPLATTDRLVVSLATDGASVFWIDANSPTVDVSTNDGRLRAVPIAGGDVTLLADNQDTPSGLALVSDQIYWAARGGFFNAQSENSGGVWRVAKSGGAPAAVVSGLPEVTAFDSDAAHVAYVEVVDVENGTWALRVRAR